MIKRGSKVRVVKMDTAGGMDPCPLFSLPGSCTSLDCTGNHRQIDVYMYKFRRFTRLSA